LFFACHEQIELDEVQLLCTEEEEKKGRGNADIHLTPITETPSTKKSPLPPRSTAEKLREKIYTVRMFLSFFLFIIIHSSHMRPCVK